LEGLKNFVVWTKKQLFYTNKLLDENLIQISHVATIQMEQLSEQIKGLYSVGGINSSDTDMIQIVNNVKEMVETLNDTSSE